MTHKIAMAQIDPNGTCNAKCWFCPVAYVPNPAQGKTIMPIALFESIIQQLMEGKGDFVAQSFNGIYTAHYNEVLMYPHFEAMLDVLSRHNLNTIILSNGTPLTKHRTDIIKKYKRIINGVCLNIPSAFPDEWARLTGFNIKVFSSLLDNIQYFHDQLPEYVKNQTFSIQINGLNTMSLGPQGGWVEVLPNAPTINLDPATGDLHRSFLRFKELFPDLNVHEMPSLIDRAGYLDTHQIITNKPGIDRYLKQDKKQVIGCGNGIEVGGRPRGWIHINANGDMFICCNDYDFDTVFGNIRTIPIKDIWMGEQHQAMIIKSYNTMCRTCASALWG